MTTPVGFRADEGIAILERTPAVLRALLADLPEAWTRADEGAGTWSAFDVVGHLIDGEETDWIPRARIILEGGGSGAFEPFDRLRHRERNRGKTLGALLDEFAGLRRRNVAALRGFRLTGGSLERTGIHPELGRVTLGQHLATWVAHDLDHLVQIARSMAKRYGAAVGPWRAYLRVLRDPD